MSSNEKVPLIIDTSEDDKLVRLFQEDGEFEILQQDLPVGDYLFGSGVAVERKESDFFSSLAGHRLDRQLAELRVNYPRCILVIVGPLGDKVKWSSGMKVFQTAKAQMAWGLGSIAGFAIDHGVSVVMVNDRQEFVEFMRHVGKHAKKLAQVSSHGSPPEGPSGIQATSFAGVTFKKADRSLREIQRDLIRSVSGIGADKALRLLDVYGSPAEVAIAAQQGKLRSEKKVPGIGPKTEEALVQAFLVRAE